MFTNLWHQMVLRVKDIFYGRSGEPYHIRGLELRYLPGTRPVRLDHSRSSNDGVRYDALQVKLLSTALAEGDTAIDIGAHCGQYSILMAAICGWSGHVVAFEPDPVARKKLVQNLDLNPSVKRPIVENLACSDTDGEAIFYNRNGNSQSSLARFGAGLSGTDKSEEIRVPIITLDAYMARHHLPEPRWVKIDTEGAEVRILKGATNLLRGGVWNSL